MNKVSINLVYLPKFGQVGKRYNMGLQIFQQVKDNYTFYNNLLSERKSIFTEVIEINEKGNNHLRVEATEVVRHPGISQDDMVLIVDVQINNHNYFQFKLRYKTFLPRPFFRFDSDGETHRNKIDGIPLHEQSITTPHFHKFNHDGIEIAYKTAKLLNPEEANALQDINLCIAHFFHESNTRLKEEDFPEIQIMTDTLNFKMSDEDPNQNINFL